MNIYIFSKEEITCSGRWALKDSRPARCLATHHCVNPHCLIWICCHRKTVGWCCQQLASAATRQAVVTKSPTPPDAARRISSVCVCWSVCMWVCVCVCVCEGGGEMRGKREGEREREREREKKETREEERERKRERASVCVCVCARVREKEVGGREEIPWD